MRSFEEIEESIAKDMGSFSNREIDLSEGSIMRSIVRSLASAQLQYDANLEKLEKDSDVSLAKGEALDRVGYWLDRSPASRAKGYIVVENLSDSSIDLEDGAVVAYEEENLLYRVSSSNSGSRKIPPRLSVAVPIEAQEVGESYNLPSGTSLLCLNYPNLEARVGSGVTLQGKVCGPLQNGRSSENDESFRVRLLNSAKKLTVATDNWIEQKLLSREDLNNVKVDTVSGGIVQVLIDSPTTLTQQSLNAIQSEVESYTVSGITALVKQARRNNVNIELEVQSNSDIDQTSLSDSIRAMIFDYTRQLSPNKSFNPEELERGLFSLYPDLILKLPRKSIELGSEDLVYPNRINISYVSKL